MKNIFEGLIFINGFVYKSKTSRALLRDLAGNSYYDKPLASSLCFVIDIIVIHFCGFPFFLFAFMTSIPEELLDQVDYLQRFHLSTRVTLMINGPSRLLIKSNQKLLINIFKPRICSISSFNSIKSLGIPKAVSKQVSVDDIWGLHVFPSLVICLSARNQLIWLLRNVFAIKKAFLARRKC